MLARRPLREIAAEPTLAFFEEFIHAGRIHAVSSGYLKGTGVSDQMVVDRLAILEDRVLKQLEYIKKAAYLNRHPFDIAGPVDLSTA